MFEQMAKTGKPVFALRLLQTTLKWLFLVHFRCVAYTYYTSSSDMHTFSTDRRATFYNSVAADTAAMCCAYKRDGRLTFRLASRIMCGTSCDFTALPYR